MLNLHAGVGANKEVKKKQRFKNEYNLALNTIRKGLSLENYDRLKVIYIYT